MKLREEWLTVFVGLFLVVALLSTYPIEHYSGEKAENHLKHEEQLLTLTKSYVRTIAFQSEYLEMLSYSAGYDQVPGFWGRRVSDTPQNFTIQTGRGLYIGGVNYNDEDRLIWGNKTNMEFFDYRLNNLRSEMQKEQKKVNYLEENQLNYLASNINLENSIYLWRTIQISATIIALLLNMYLLVRIGKRLRE